ncbi:efflux RND transporter periplasmic adaptor subunit [Paenibacillus sp. GCM10027626]|uniref:efflux RND transporter periplasmic adaptor subunit n=1 Tax=Paenibacillus sp. GCM10027626 TaxID=3273411 RepID=UPI00362FF481
MKKKIKWIVIGVILIAISYVLYTISQPKKPMEQAVGTQAISFDVTEESLVNTVEVKGKSLYEQEVPVYAPFSSKVKEWKAEDGQQVKKGDVLFTLDQTHLQNEIEQEEASMRKAKLETELQTYMSQLGDSDLTLEATEADRKRTLVNKEIARLNRELGDVTASLQRKSLDQKKALLGKAQYYAPASGIFLYDTTAAKRPQAVGDDQYIGKIVDLSKLQFIALVGEQDVFHIKPGMSVQVKMNAMKEVQLAGKVLRVSKFAKTGTDQNSMEQAAQFEVTITLESNEYLIAGLTLNGQIETERRDKVTVVPTIAVMRDKDAYYVMLDKGNGQYERKDIKVGMETSEKTEVLEGLKPGDKVVIE